MRPLTRFAISALFALACASLASAEPPAIEPGAIASVTDMELDDAFEKTTAHLSDEFLRRLAEPTSMDCTNAATRDPSETCVVTAEREPVASVPAALAQH
jgi:hypothetical protein